jgi:uncharacterized protein (TIGR04255 family)
VFEGNPLTASPPPEVPLDRAPLIRVLAQVRFPPILSIADSSYVAAFQEAIREEYPTLRPEQILEAAPGRDGVPVFTTSVVWRFTDRKEQWRVSLTNVAITLETTNYLSRTDFLQRFSTLIHSVNIHVKPKILERLGVRYIARIAGGDMNNLVEFVRPEVSGILSSEIANNSQQSISDSVFTTEQGLAQIHAVWGRLPASATTDHATIELIDEPSWILDLDMSTTPVVGLQDFEEQAIAERSRHFSERLYTFFRWAVTERFLLHYGGKLES